MFSLKLQIALEKKLHLLGRDLEVNSTLKNVSKEDEERVVEDYCKIL